MRKKILFIAISLLFSLLQIIDAQCLITGQISDEDGNRLIGATIMVKGTTIGTVADIDGRFTIEAPNCQAVLLVSYTGYDSMEVSKITPDKPMTIVLNQGIALEEVVVLKKESKIKRPLSDKVAGVQSSRRMGKIQDRRAPAVRLRGNATIAPPSIMPYQEKEREVNFNTEDYSIINENRFLEVGQNPLSTFSIDVDAASYSNLRRFIQNGQAPPPDAVRIEEMVNYFNYDYPQPTGEHPFTVASELSNCPWNADHKLLHVGLQGKTIPTENLPASNLVFLIDVSGSMNQANKLPLLQSSFKLLVDQLREQDRVAIVVYAGAAGMVLPSTSAINKREIKKAIEKLQAGGSTAGGAGIQLAYKVASEHFVENGNNRVILATDGDFNVGTSSDAELVRIIEEKRKSGIFLTVLGFGTGNYKDNKMQQLANKGNGNHAYIDNINEAKKVLVNEFGGTLFTIAKDVKFQIEFNPAHVQGYRLTGYENRMLNKEDFNDDKKDAGELGSGHTVTALYEIIPTGVKSDFLASVDELKYQRNKNKGITEHSDELLTLKLRYKEPKGSKSKLIIQPVIDNSIDLDNTSNNFRFAAAVAEFGMLLRNSEFKSKANYAQTLELAKGAKGKDENGYRQEMINMLEVMQSIAAPEVAGK